jgi:hypothetical protein
MGMVRSLYTLDQPCTGGHELLLQFLGFASACRQWGTFLDKSQFTWFHFSTRLIRFDQPGTGHKLLLLHFLGFSSACRAVGASS